MVKSKDFEFPFKTARVLLVPVVLAVLLLSYFALYTVVNCEARVISEQIHNQSERLTCCDEFQKLDPINDIWDMNAGQTARLVGRLESFDQGLEVARLRTNVSSVWLHLPIRGRFARAVRPSDAAWQGDHIEIAVRRLPFDVTVPGIYALTYGNKTERIPYALLAVIDVDLASNRNVYTFEPPGPRGFYLLAAWVIFLAQTFLMVWFCSRKKEYIQLLPYWVVSLSILIFHSLVGIEVLAIRTIPSEGFLGSYGYQIQSFSFVLTFGVAAMFSFEFSTRIFGPTQDSTIGARFPNMLRSVMGTTTLIALAVSLGGSFLVLSMEFEAYRPFSMILLRLLTTILGFAIGIIASSTGIYCSLVQDKESEDYPSSFSNLGPPWRSTTIAYSIGLAFSATIGTVLGVISIAYLASYPPALLSSIEMVVMAPLIVGVLASLIRKARSA